LINLAGLSDPRLILPYFRCEGSNALPKAPLTELLIKQLDFAKYLARHYAHLTPDQRSKMKQFDIFDTKIPRLFLRVSSGGTLAWRVIYYLKGDKGRAGTLGLGRYPFVTLAEAREAATPFMTRGGAEKELKKLAEAAKEEQRQHGDTFETVWTNYLNRKVIKSGMRSRPQLERMIKLHVLPKWKDRRFAEIKNSDVTRLLDHIEDKSGGKVADAVFVVVKRIMRWEASRKDPDEYVYPLPIVSPQARGSSSPRQRSLSDSEIKVLWKVTATMGRYGAIVRLALLTAQRRDKLATMMWKDIREGVWHIATDENEKFNAGKIKLPEIALEIIEAQPRSSRYVFPAGRGGGEFTAFAICFKELKARMRVELPDMPDFVLHDLRRTARSLMSRLGINREVAERCLGHRVGNAIENTYNVYEFETEMAAAFNSLANLIASINDPAAPSNVVPLRA